MTYPQGETIYKLTHRFLGQAHEVIASFSQLNSEGKCNRIVGYLQKSYAEGIEEAMSLPKEEAIKLVKWLRRRAEKNIEL